VDTPAGSSVVSPDALDGSHPRLRGREGRSRARSVTLTGRRGTGQATCRPASVARSSTGERVARSSPPQQRRSPLARGEVMAIAKQPSAKATALTGFVCKIKGDELCSSKGSSYPQTIPQSKRTRSCSRRKRESSRRDHTANRKLALRT
jgi:hypothetical protein